MKTIRFARDYPELQEDSKVQVLWFVPDRRVD